MSTHVGMQTTRHSLIKARLASIRRDLDKIIDRLTPELMQWVPAEGMRTVSGQLVEIVAIEMQLVPRLKEGTEIADSAVDTRIGDCGRLDSLRRLLIDVRQETLNYLDTLSESDLAEEVSYCGAWFGSLWLPTLPRAEIFLNIAEHEFYHVGQLTSYLWCRGDHPYHW